MNNHVGVDFDTDFEEETTKLMRATQWKLLTALL